MAFEAVQALDIRLRPVVQDSGAIDQDVAVVVDRVAPFLYLDLPFALLAVLNRSGDSGVVLYVPIEVVLLPYPAKVVVNLATSGVEI